MEDKRKNLAPWAGRHRGLPIALLSGTGYTKDIKTAALIIL
jgi:hypothetical protein